MWDLLICENTVISLLVKLIEFITIPKHVITDFYFTKGAKKVL